MCCRMLQQEHFCDIFLFLGFALSQPCVTDWRRGIGWSGWSGWSPCGKMMLRFGCYLRGTVGERPHGTRPCHCNAAWRNAPGSALSGQANKRGARVAHVRQVRARVSRRSFVDTQTGTSETVFPASSRDACCSFVAHEARRFWCLQQSSRLSEGRACSPGLCPDTFSSNTSSCCTFSSLTSVPHTLLRSQCPNVPWLWIVTLIQPFLWCLFFF